MTPRRIVILGAARSGTKILRDVLAEATGGGRVPYDVGFVWRYGNERAADDVLAARQATPEIRRFIERYLDRYAAGCPPVVFEKTVGNTMRVPFVHAVLPDATFVQLIRDGVDVVASARQEWAAPPDLRYLMEKARHVPLRVLPAYGSKYVAGAFGQRRRGAFRASTWGPRYPGIDLDLAMYTLLRVVAKQWRFSVEMAAAGLRTINATCVQVRYEDLVQHPQAELTRVLNDLALPADPVDVQRAAARVVPRQLGTGLQGLCPEERSILQSEIGATLESLGYSSLLRRKGAL